MKILLLIGFGSFIGGVLRYIISVIIQTRFLGSFPYGTLTVNIIGCFFIGLLLGLSEKMVISNEARFFITTGLLGGFTTFSAFSAETIALMRIGQTGHALTYVVASVSLGLLATFIGVWAARFF